MKITAKQVYESYAKGFKALTGSETGWASRDPAFEKLWEVMAADINAAIEAEALAETQMRYVFGGGYAGQQQAAALQNAQWNQMQQSAMNAEAGMLAAYQQRAAMQMQAAPPETKRSETWRDAVGIQNAHHVCAGQDCSVAVVRDADYCSGCIANPARQHAPKEQYTPVCQYCLARHPQAEHDECMAKMRANSRAHSEVAACSACKFGNAGASGLCSYCEGQR